MTSQKAQELIKAVAWCQTAAEGLNQ